MAKIVFDHLPKCGGTSVRRFLAACVGEHLIAPPLTNVSVGRALRLFERFDVLTGHFAGQVLVHAHPDIRFITLLRHPLDRIVSAYYFQRQPIFEGLENPGVKAARAMSLKEYVNDRSGAAADANQNNMTLHFAAARGALVSSEDMLAAAMTNIMRYDVVGVLEDLPGFFDRLARRFGWTTPQGAFHERITPDRPAAEEVDVEIRAIIESNNALDIALYDSVRAFLNGDAGSLLATPGDTGERDSQHMDSCSVRLLGLNGARESHTTVVSGALASIRAEIGVPATLAGELYAIVIVRDAVDEVVYKAASRLEVLPGPGTFVIVPLEVGLVMRLAEGQYTVDLCIQGGHHSDTSVGVVRRGWLQIDVAGYGRSWFAGVADLEARWGSPVK